MWSPAGFAETLDDIYECATSPSAWARALETLARRFRCASAAIEWLGLEGETRALFEFGADQKYLRRLVDQFDQEADRPPSRTRRFSDFEGAGLLAGRDGGASWVRPAGFRDAICLDLLANGRRARLTLARSSVQTGFAEAERQGLGELAPHLTRVAEVADALALQRLASNRLQDALDALATPLALTGAPSDPVIMNQAARRLADSGRVLSVEGGRLALLAAPNASSRVARRPLEVSVSPARGESYLVNQGAGKALVHVVGLGPREDGLGSLVAVASPEPRARTLSGVFARLHRLSPVEARVLEALSTGGTVESIAAQLCLSGNTIKTHLKALFAKTATRKQGELLHRYLSCNDTGVDLAALSERDVSSL